MSQESAPLHPGEILARRVKEARERRGWTQKQLAEELTGLGLPTARTTIVQIERGGTRASRAPLEEIMALALALSVAPVHLLVPIENETDVALTPTRTVHAKIARAWVRGIYLFDDADPLAFMAELPEEELHAFVRDYLRSQRLADSGPVAGSGARKLANLLHGDEPYEEQVEATVARLNEAIKDRAFDFRHSSTSTEKEDDRG